MKFDPKKLNRAFNPRCVVVIGDKSENGFSWLCAQSNFKGKLYSVQIDPREIEGIRALGITNFTSLEQIEEPVDLAIVAVPRAIAPKILDDCICKDVAAAHFFTSGFAETGTKEGIDLESRLARKAQQAGFHLIGPNCMGVYNPEIGIKQTQRQYSDVNGPVGIISQSGTHAINFAYEAHLQGININKSVSFGNGTVLDSTDFLEYFGKDPAIEIIGMYLEGVKDGRRFTRVLKEVSGRKPVVIWKGGRTIEGDRAIASHTGAMAVSKAVWDTAIAQQGAVSVSNLEELIDTIKSLLFLTPVFGDGVGIVGGSGGQSVAIADAFAEAGLRLPALTRQSYDELSKFFVLIGGGYQNPIDTGNVNNSEIERILGILEKDANIDNLVLLVNRWRNLESQISSIIEIRHSSFKPAMAIVPYSFSPGEVEQCRAIITKLQEGGVPAFISLERGACALKNALGYYKRE